MSYFALLGPLMEALQVKSLAPKMAVEVDMTNIVGGLEAGDHIAVVKDHEEHWHHGIYIGRDNDMPMVMDFGGETKEAAKINKRPLRNFIAGAEVMAKVQYDGDTTIRRLMVIFMAMATPEIWPKGRGGMYNAAFNNCECFATFCWSGECVNILYNAFCITHFVYYF